MTDTGKDPDGNAALTARILRWLGVISSLLAILVVLAGVVGFLATSAADVREVRVEQTRMAAEMAEMKLHHSVELAKLETRLETDLATMNPVLRDIQSRVVRLETTVEMALRKLAEQ